jgi:hypothetical protein
MFIVTKRECTIVVFERLLLKCSPLLYLANTHRGASTEVMVTKMIITKLT